MTASTQLKSANSEYFVSVGISDSRVLNVAAGESTVHDDILSTVGNTPIVRINKLAPEGVNVYAKLEAFNPLGSVKDRLAKGIIEAAERDGSLQAGQTVIEASSGNTGIGLAMVCAQKGYPLVVTMAENFSIERRKLMRFLGAKVILTPAAKMGSGMLAKAKELAESHGWYLCRQFSNEVNAEVHSKTTAREILKDFPDQTLDYFVTGFGTGGTLKGVARVLKSDSPNTRVVAVEPENSPVMRSGIAQDYSDDGDPLSGHPSFRPHVVQGWAPDFMSSLTSDAVNDHLIDEICPVSGRESLILAREMARREGVFCGISSGATLAGALTVAKKAAKGSNILCMFPDTGERYLSTPLFDDIPVEMTEEELSISETTAGYRFDAAKTVEKKSALNALPRASESAREFLTTTVSQYKTASESASESANESPVVMFSLEWCEFCRSVRKLLDRLGVQYQSIELDSVEYQADNRGADIRRALVERTQKSTIPQIFVAGKHLGGCTDIFDMYKNGSLTKLFADIGITTVDCKPFDPYELLPGWLHPR